MVAEPGASSTSSASDRMACRRGSDGITYHLLLPAQTGGVLAAKRGVFFLAEGGEEREILLDPK